MKKERILIWNCMTDERKYGWRLYISEHELYEISDEHIIKLKGKEKGEMLIAEYEKEVLCPIMN